MRRMTWFILFLTVAVYAQSAEINQNDEVSRNALVTVFFNSTAQLVVNGELFGHEDLNGRKYLIPLTYETGGTIIESGGYILAPHHNEKKMMGDALTFVLEPMLDDLGRIKHRKEYGVDATKDELAFHKNYLIEKTGGREKIVELLHEHHEENGITLHFEHAPARVFLSENAREARLVNTSGDLAILKIEKENMPAVELKNKTIQNGDGLFFVSKAEVKTNIVIQNELGEYRLIEETEDGLTAIIHDGAGRPVAVQFGNRIVSSQEVEEILERNNIEKRPSDTNVQFRQALDEYGRGNLDRARERFEKTLASYPEHEGAREYLKKIENQGKTGPFAQLMDGAKSLRGKLKKITDGSILSLGALILVISVAGILVLQILGRKK